MEHMNATFPLIDVVGFSAGTNFVIAFVIGIGFGFFLERAGFGSATKLAMQFYFRDLTVLKVMFTAIVTAMSGLIFLSATGWLDISLLYINPTYLWPGVVGGLIMGAGFIIGGYCPGTALVGVVTAKTDALFSVLGALLGMFVFGELMAVGAFRAFYALQTDDFAGRLTLPEVLGTTPGVVGLGVLLMALAGFVGAEWAERRFAWTAREAEEVPMEFSAGAAT
jgi:hypothetical protein